MHSLYRLHNMFHLLPLLMFPSDSQGVIFRSQLVVVQIARSAVTEWLVNVSRQSGSAKHAKFHCVCTHVSSVTTHSNITSELCTSKTFYLYINPLYLVSCSIIYSSLCTYCNFSSMYPLLTMYIALEILVYSFVPFILLYTPASLPQSTFTLSYSYFR